MKRNRNLFICLIALMTIAAVLPAYAQAAEAPKVLRWAYTMPRKVSSSIGWEWIGPEFEKRTNGRYKVEYYPSGTLFQMVSAYDAVQAGVAQVTAISVGSYEKRLPLSNVVTLPTLGLPAGLKARLFGGKAFLEMTNKFPQLLAEYKGVKLLGIHDMDPTLLVSKKKEVTLPEHLKGMKIGATGYKAQLVKNSGGVDLLMYAPDAYMGMDKGVIDGIFVGWTAVGSYKLFEIAKYYFDYSFGTGAFAVLMNEAFWNGISPSDQNIFMELWDKSYEMSSANTAAESERGSKAAYGNSRCIVKKASPQEDAAWKKVAASTWQEWVRDAKSQGADDPEAILAEWKRIVETYKE